MFELGVKPFDFGLEVVWIGRKSSLKAVRSEMFNSTDEENIDCRRDKPMTAIVCVRVETPTNFTGLTETPDVCMGVSEMPYVCT